MDVTVIVSEMSYLTLKLGSHWQHFENQTISKIIIKIMFFIV